MSTLPDNREDSMIVSVTWLAHVLVKHNQLICALAAEFLLSGGIYTRERVAAKYPDALVQTGA